ncbi:MAG: translational GTPase TypA [Aminobacterium sp.]|jgi:GTP-binding protein|nr:MULTISPECIES: translational GTPase TypA [unclassified Aminobacterium]MDD2206021.1 translational GTPase TypA [Aminobacterium sp.]MDD3425748.1 translational GTPase TypA [Aminobacterium sp.]MDD4227822.1 translational GTPase TypA [Aminobacterium sp.]MDD4550738.1 translational GTPase TypA [Aminobacterium sp.]MEA4877360.1 translational GTPase TypA [Aminobacterium sp.]
MVQAEKIRNLAIIAHIDHGKTTLIDSIFKSAQVFRKGAHVEERVMDSNEIERERGITIRAKHCTVEWKDYLINIIDTPGHADFSGEVERILSTVDSVLLLVDANEGPMPQTRYVLMRALAMGLRPIVFINKIDRPNANPTVVLNQTFDLFIELGATEEQVDFPILYGSGLDGWAVRDLEKDPHEGMNALFETIIDYVPAPHVDPHSPFLMQVSTLAWNEYTGRIGCGKVLQGTLRKGEDFIRYSTKWKDVANKSGEWEVCGKEETRSVKMWITRGLDRQEVEEISAGDIVWISGPQEINIGDTFCSPEIEGKTLQPLAIEEPTVSMFFLINNGPFSGREGQPITLRQLKARLEREMHVNVALRVEDIGRPDGLKVSGRGELHLSILIEEMRREGMEFCVSKPEVITRNENDRLLEPMEELTIDVPEEYQGVVFEKLSRRKARLLSMENTRTGLIRLVFQIPTRGLIGYRGEFLTDTRGLGIMNTIFTGYGEWAGEISPRNRGSMVSLDTGEATSYQLENLQERGTLFIEPGDPVYEGMIVGENSRPGDLPCNPTKKKQATNHRSATKDMTIKLDVPRKMSLEKAMEWIADEELVEVTPKSIRIRKAILDSQERKKASKKAS